MTSAIAKVSAEVARYIDAVGGDPSAVAEVHAHLVQVVVGGLQPGETVLRVVCMRNPRPDWTTADGIAVLTDRAVLLAVDGGHGQRISLWDVVRVNAVDIEIGGVHYPALGLARGPLEERIVASPVEGWSYDRARGELQSFASAVQEAASQAKRSPRPPEPVGRCSTCRTIYQGTTCPTCASQSPGAGQVSLLSKQGTSGATLGQEFGSAKFIGDAAPIGGIPLSRLLNAACYFIAGVAGLVLAGQPEVPTLLAVLLGLASMTYGAKILLTRSSYWVSSAVYAVAFFAVVGAISLMAS
jgi:hypothetical protein